MDFTRKMSAESVFLHLPPTMNTRKKQARNLYFPISVFFGLTIGILKISPVLAW